MLVHLIKFERGQLGQFGYHRLGVRCLIIGHVETVRLARLLGKRFVVTVILPLLLGIESGSNGSLSSISPIVGSRQGHVRNSSRRALTASRARASRCENFISNLSSLHFRFLWGCHEAAFALAS